MRKILVWAILALCLVTPTLAKDFVVINSQNWQDVYAGVQYAKLKGLDSRFITSQPQSFKLPIELKKENDYQIIESRNNYGPGYVNVLNSRGYRAQEISIQNNVNLELANKLITDEGINKYIIVDDSVGYNALAAAPYAIASKSFVIFANAVNIDEVSDFFQTNTPDKLLIFGHVRREVSEALAEYNPEILDKGNRFENNVAIVRKFLEIRKTNQTILSNGEFIEDELMNGKDPIIFIGRHNIPDGTKEFIKEIGVINGVLIGNDLIDTATYVKRELGLYVFVKFAKSTVIDGSQQKLVDLDQFPVARFGLAINILQARYNLVTKMLEVRYANLLDSPVYLKSTIVLGKEILGDEEARFIDGLQEKTITYDVDLPENLSSDIVAAFTTLYGESPQSLEFLMLKNLSMTSIRILDDSQVNIIDIKYSTSRGRFIITVENTGSTDAYVSAEVIDALIDEVKTTISSENAISISPGKTGEVTIRKNLEKADLEDNPNVFVRIYYGERESAMIKTDEAEIPLSLKTLTLVYVGAGIAILILLVLIFFLFKRRKKKEEHPPRHTLHNPSHLHR